MSEIAVSSSQCLCALKMCPGRTISQRPVSIFFTSYFNSFLCVFVSVFLCKVYLTFIICCASLLNESRCVSVLTPHFGKCFMCLCVCSGSVSGSFSHLRCYYPSPSFTIGLQVDFLSAFSKTLIRSHIFFVFNFAIAVPSGGRKVQLQCQKSFIEVRICQET